MIVNLHDFIEASKVGFERFISCIVFVHFFDMLILIDLPMYDFNVQDCVVKLLLDCLIFYIVLFEQ